MKNTVICLLLFGISLTASAQEKVETVSMRYETQNDMPLFYQKMKENLTYPMAWGNSSIRNFRKQLSIFQRFGRKFCTFNFGLFVVSLFRSAYGIFRFWLLDDTVFCSAERLCTELSCVNHNRFFSRQRSYYGADYCRHSVNIFPAVVFCSFCGFDSFLKKAFFAE